MHSSDTAKRNFFLKLFVVLAGALAVGVAGFWLSAPYGNLLTAQNTIIKNYAKIYTPEQIAKAKEEKRKIVIGNFLLLSTTLIFTLVTLGIIVTKDLKIIELLQKMEHNSASKLAVMA